MTALAIRYDPSPDPAFLLECLTARAEARAYLWAIFEIDDLHHAVDVLWRWADERGLVAFYGTDAIQAVLATAFGKHRE